MNKLYVYYNNNDIKTCYKPPAIDVMTNLNWKCIIYDEALNFPKYLIDNNIKIIIMFFLYENLIYKYMNFFIDNKIKFLIYKNDLHYLPR